MAAVNLQPTETLYFEPINVIGESNKQVFIILAAVAVLFALSMIGKKHESAN